MTGKHAEDWPSRPPLAPSSWAPGDPAPRARWLLVLAGLAAIAVVIALVIGNGISGFFWSVAGGLVVAAALVILLPSRFYTWDPGYRRRRDR